MEENIEVKDVQKTEYLDKNGLDMLWAKVKENTHNQVEAESNRATIQETRIIETKADKSELDNYAPNAALEALEKKISANTAAISNKQNAGNYLHYKTLNNEGYYEIPSVCISGSDGNTKTDIDSQSISVNRDDATNYTTITCDGISNTDNNANHVYATDGSIADLTQYAKISDAYLRCIPYYNKYTKSEIQHYQLADKEGIELSSYGTSTKLLGSDIAVSSGLEELKLTRNEISINSYSSPLKTFNVNVDSEPSLYLYDSGCNISAKIYSNPKTPKIEMRKRNYDDGSFDLKLSTDGIEMLSKTTKDIVTANNSTAHIGLDDDQTEYTYVTPLENGKVPTKYLTAATKENLGVVKVGDGLNVTDGTISVDTTAIGAGKYIPYENFQNSDTYVLPNGQKIELRVGFGERIYNSSKITAQGIYVKNASGEYVDIGSENIRVDSGGKASNDRYLVLTPSSIIIFDKRNSEKFCLDCNGIRLEGGDNNHVLTSNKSTINITQYAKKTELPTKVSQLQNDSEFITKSVYDEKIAALEARIAALEAKHTETA